MAIGIIAFALDDLFSLFINESLVTVTELAKVLGTIAKAIHAEMVRRPGSLLKWFKLPGAKTPLSLQETKPTVQPAALIAQ